MTLLSLLRGTAFTPFVVLSFLTLAHCGPGRDEYPDETSFCSGRAKAECNSEVIKACAVLDASHCIASRRTACLAATPPRTTYNRARAEHCIDAVAAAFGDARLTAEENRTTADVCALVFDGPGRVGATCQGDLDCRVSDGLRCVLTGGTASGTCQVPERVQGGGLCTTPKQLCADGFHCGTTSHCDINSQVGEPCDAALPCVTTALCGANGICVAKFQDGARCTMDDQCMHDICARGSNSPEGLCVTQMNLAPNEPFCVDAR